MQDQPFDLIVIGGGHAGIEAAAVGAKLGKRTLLLTTLIEQIGAASCNPAVGGLAKGHLVKELDALGGMMGVLTDAAGIQFRILNESKGAAVRGSRVQIDMDEYRINARNALLRLRNLQISQEQVVEFITEPATPHLRLVAVKTALGRIYHARKFILTTGTFLNGLIHVGEAKLAAGRVGEAAAGQLGASLQALAQKVGLKIGRLKTGTCPRVAALSIDFSKLQIQPGDAQPRPFSFRTPLNLRGESFAPRQLPCYIARTNEKTHELIRANFDRAPLFTGQIEGVGPRYCPSIEDKLFRFAERDSHQLFIEPQTAQATEYYINGLSTSLPYEVQLAALRTIEGFEEAVITRFGYAIEYDYIEPTQLTHALALRGVENLFCAGQINGTTGYEEAAAQGLMAGINALRELDGEPPFVLGREEAYIGVLIDDLVTKGTREPYRMFTSRAEFRLLLREENAILRLGRYGYELGLLGREEFDYIEAIRAKVRWGMEWVLAGQLSPSAENNAWLASLGEERITGLLSWQKILARPSFSTEKLKKIHPNFEAMDEASLREILTQAKYHHYTQLQISQVEKMRALRDEAIPEGLDYSALSGLSNEAVEKLSAHRPATLFAASQISGITPAALDILHIFIRTKIRG